MFGTVSFWIYAFGFSAATGSFFVFFSTAPRVLIVRPGYLMIRSCTALAMVAIVIIVTTRFTKAIVAQWGIAGSVTSGMTLLVCGAVTLGIGQTFGSPSFGTFIMPMWIMAVGIVVTVSVTANGAIGKFDRIAGSVVVFYFRIQNLIVGFVGTLAVTVLNGDSAWPLIGNSTGMATLVLAGLSLLPSRAGTATNPSQARRARPGCVVWHGHATKSP